MTTNARDFLDEIAQTIRSKGRLVEVTETDESFGKFVWMTALAPHWYDTTLTLSARYSDRTGRWALGEMSITNASGKDSAAKTRSSIRIAADVYA